MAGGVIATAVTPARGRVIGRRKVVAIPAARVTYTSEVATGVGSVLKTFAAEETPPPLVRLTLQPGDLALKYDGGQRIRENMWGGGVPREGLPIFKRPRRMRWRR